MLKLEPKLNARIQCTQEMKNYFFLLELPLLDLRNYLLAVAERNPFLEIKEKRGEALDEEKILPLDFTKDQLDSYDDVFFAKEDIEINNFAITAKENFYDFLMAQAREHFTAEDLFIANQIIGNLNERGFFTSINELAIDFNIEAEKIEKVLRIIKSFEPIGVGAKDLQESLLIQLKGKENLAYKIVKEHFFDLLNKKISQISKAFNCSEEKILHTVKKEILNLNFNPRGKFEKETLPKVIIDIVVTREGGKWIAEVLDKKLPRIIWNKYNVKYFSRALKSEKAFFKPYFGEINFLKRALSMRRKNLLKTALFIIERETEFLSGKGELKPLSLPELSINLNVHLSTAYRTIANKFILTPRGVFELRFFFSQKLLNNKKSKSVLLEQMFYELKCGKKLTDQSLAQRLALKGFKCARRTVAKYRKEILRSI